MSSANPAGLNRHGPSCTLRKHHLTRRLHQSTGAGSFDWGQGDAEVGTAFVNDREDDPIGTYLYRHRLVTRVGEGPGEVHGHRRRSRGFIARLRRHHGGRRTRSVSRTTCATLPTPGAG